MPIVKRILHHDCLLRGDSVYPSVENVHGWLRHRGDGTLHCADSLVHTHLSIYSCGQL
jgi:hypothetical protein